MLAPLLLIFACHGSWAAETEEKPAGPPPAMEVELDGSLATARARTLATHPELGRARAAWASAQHRTARARSIPDPTVSVGMFVQPVETRVGPQRARVSVQQALPWPATLRGQREAAEARAAAGGAALEATVLDLQRRVDVAYWDLWELRARRAALSDHLTVLDGLSRTVGARVETGVASLAALSQVDLARARLADRVASLDARETAARARLAALLGAGPGEALPTTDTPPAPAAARRPAPPADHPALDRARAAEAEAAAQLDVARAQRRPGLMLGADWIITGPSPMEDVEDSGKDAVAVGLGLRLPVTWRAHRDDIRAAAAAREGAAQGTDLARRTLEEATVAAAAEVDDTARRHALTEQTLLPQAEAVYAALLGAFAAGRAPLGDLLLAQRELLDLRIQSDSLAAAHARAQATLAAVSDSPSPPRQPEEP